MKLISPRASTTHVKFLVLLLFTVLVAVWALYKLHIQPSSDIKPTALHLDPLEVYEKYPIDLENATAVFNSVNGALKQKHANMNPVGVSFIPAYIPPNSLLYHSTSSAKLPELFEWIAMDYEFS